MTYNPLIPIGSHNISVDRSAIQINFQQADVIFANDHYAFDDATSANRGYHKQVYFPLVSGSAPSLGSFAGVIFALNDPNDTALKPQLYWKNSSNTYQMTNRFRSSGSTGYWMMDNGSGTTGSTMIMMWGTASIANTASGQTNVTFPTIANYTGGPAGFPNNVYNIQVTLQGSSSNSGITYIISSGTPPTTTGFQFRFSNNTQAATFYWQAIGN